MELIGPYLAACLLLVVAGVSKASRAEGEALPSGLRATAVAKRHLLRPAAVVEALLGVCGMVVADRFVALAVAAVYGGFAVFVVVLRRRDNKASCGCFGVEVSPATRLHVVLDFFLAAAGLSVATGLGSVPRAMTSVLAAQPADGLPLLLAALLCSVLLLHALVRLPRTQAASRAVRDGLGR